MALGKGFGPVLKKSVVMFISPPIMNATLKLITNCGCHTFIEVKFRLGLGVALLDGHLN